MKVIVFLLLAIFSFTLTPSVFAQDLPTPTAKSRPVREAIKASIEAKQVERVEKLSAVRKEKIMSFSNRMILRLEALVDRLQILIDRIDARIAKIDESGEDIDTEPIKELVDEAKAKLAVLKIQIAELKEEFGNLPDSDDPKSQFVEVREKITEVKILLKEIHAMLVGVVGDIKGLRVGNSTKVTPVASPTPASTP